MNFRYYYLKNIYHYDEKTNIFYLHTYIWIKSSLDAMLALFKTTSPQKMTRSDCITLYSVYRGADFYYNFREATTNLLFCGQSTKRGEKVMGCPLRKKIFFYFFYLFRFFFYLYPFFWQLNRGGGRGLQALVDCPLKKKTLFFSRLP